MLRHLKKSYSNMINRWKLVDGELSAEPTWLSDDAVFKSVYIAGGTGLVKFFIPLTLITVMNTFLVIQVHHFPIFSGAYFS